MNRRFMQIAIDLALAGVQEKNHGPFGAVIIRRDDLVGAGVNQVTARLDPTAHAEISAIRDACLRLNTFSLQGCEIYTSCEPCPMCLGAILWARLDKVYYGATRYDAATIQFSDEDFYEEIKKDPSSRNVPMVQIMRNECLELFSAWEKNLAKVPY